MAEKSYSFEDSCLKKILCDFFNSPAVPIVPLFLLANKGNQLITDDDVRKWIADKKTNTGEFNYLFIPKQ